MITVLGRATSSNVQAVMWCAAELGLEVERRDMGGAFGGTKTPEYLAMNPNGLIPTVLIGGEAFWESAAIVRALSALHGDEGFWPRDPIARLRGDKWAEWAKTTLAPVLIYRVFVGLVRLAPEKRDPGEMLSACRELARLMTLLEAHLSGSDWIGEGFSFADIVPGHLMYRFHELAPEIDAILKDAGEALPPFPAVARWYAALQARPAYAEHVMISFESLRNTA